jgi:polyhydroxyalkanoate synthesis regulator phasin
LLGLGGISEKIKSILEKVQAPVGKVIDTVVGTIVKAGKKVWSKLKSAGRTVKDKALGALDWIAQKIGLKRIAKPFTMTSGEPHTLTAVAAESGLTVNIASAFAGDIKKVIPDLEREAKNLPATDRTPAMSQIAAIKNEMGSITTAEQAWLKNKKAKEARTKKIIDERVKKGKITAAQAPAEQQKLLEAAEQRLYQPIEETLAKLLRPLKQLKSMAQFLDRPAGRRKLPPGYDVRAKLYERGSGWASKSAKARTRLKESLLANVKEILREPDKNRAAERIKWLQDRDKVPADSLDLFMNNKLTYKYIAETRYAIDHKVPLAQHWTQSGSKSGDSVRQDFCVQESNWNFITFSANSKYSGGGYEFRQKPYVESSFTSSYADGGIPNAKRIDGIPMLDDKDKPLS